MRRIKSLVQFLFIALQLNTSTLWAQQPPVVPSSAARPATTNETPPVELDDSFCSDAQRRAGQCISVTNGEALEFRNANSLRRLRSLHATYLGRIQRYFHRWALNLSRFAQNRDHDNLSDGDRQRFLNYLNKCLTDFTSSERGSTAARLATQCNETSPIPENDPRMNDQMRALIAINQQLRRTLYLSGVSVERCQQRLADQSNQTGSTTNTCPDDLTHARAVSAATSRGIRLAQADLSRSERIHANRQSPTRRAAETRIEDGSDIRRTGAPRDACEQRPITIAQQLNCSSLGNGLAQRTRMTEFHVSQACMESTFCSQQPLFRAATIAMWQETMAPIYAQQEVDYFQRMILDQVLVAAQNASATSEKDCQQKANDTLNALRRSTLATCQSRPDFTRHINSYLEHDSNRTSLYQQFLTRCLVTNRINLESVNTPQDIAHRKSAREAMLLYQATQCELSHIAITTGSGTEENAGREMLRNNGLRPTQEYFDAHQRIVRQRAATPLEEQATRNETERRLGGRHNHVHQVCQQRGFPFNERPISSAPPFAGLTGTALANRLHHYSQCLEARLPALRSLPFDRVLDIATNPEQTPFPRINNTVRNQSRSVFENQLGQLCNANPTQRMPFYLLNRLTSNRSEFANADISRAIQELFNCDRRLHRDQHNAQEWGATGMTCAIAAASTLLAQPNTVHAAPTCLLDAGVAAYDYYQTTRNAEARDRALNSIGQSANCLAFDDSGNESIAELNRSEERLLRSAGRALLEGAALAQFLGSISRAERALAQLPPQQGFRTIRGQQAPASAVATPSADVGNATLPGRLRPRPEAPIHVAPATNSNPLPATVQGRPARPPVVEVSPAATPVNAANTPVPRSTPRPAMPSAEEQRRALERTTRARYQQNPDAVYTPRGLGAPIPQNQILPAGYRWQLGRSVEINGTTRTLHTLNLERNAETSRRLQQIHFNADTGTLSHITINGRSLEAGGTTRYNIRFRSRSYDQVTLEGGSAHVTNNSTNPLVTPRLTFRTKEGEIITVTNQELQHIQEYIPN